MLKDYNNDKTQQQQQHQQQQQQSPLHEENPDRSPPTPPPSPPLTGSTSFSFPRPIWDAWQNRLVRESSTMPVDNKRIAGPEITQPVVLREEKRLRKPLVTSIMRFRII